jgi:hypothetical protein
MASAAERPIFRAGPRGDELTNDIRAAEAFPLGDRVVNRLGYGAMQLAGPGVFGPPKNRAGKSQYLVAGNMTALFDAAMVGVGGVVARLRYVRGRIVEKGPVVGLQREQIIAAAGDDPFGDVGLGPHGVDGDERVGQLQSFEQ